MKIVIPGGTGQVGGLLRRALAAQGHEVVVLSRRGLPLEAGIRSGVWDGRTLGDWIHEIDGSDAVINLAGRSVSCRYNDKNLREMMNSRVASTRVVGEAIAVARNPPKVWLQMSTATIYADTRVGSNDEATGEIGGDEANVPLYWEYSVRIAKCWEAAQLELDLPHTRRVALRSAMIMTPDSGGIFDALLMLTRLGLGGPVAGGDQRVSWIHGHDFLSAVMFLLRRDEMEGPVNLASPQPVRQADFMKTLRHVWGRGVGLPATAMMAVVGAWLLRTDTELLLKSRSVVPARLVESGFEFAFPDWKSAAENLVCNVRSRPDGSGLPATIGRLWKLSKG